MPLNKFFHPDILPYSVKGKLKNILESVLRIVNFLNPPLVHPAPVFVSGNQKSGTTVIAALLGRISGKPYKIDVLHHARRNSSISFQDYVDLNKRWFAAEIIKDPYFTFIFIELKEVFSEFRFVFVIRDPRDNIRSLLNRMQIPGNLKSLNTSQFDHLEQIGWRWIFQDAMRNNPDIHYIEILANYWNKNIEAYKIYDQEIILIRYEDFVADKIGQIIKLAHAVGVKPITDIRKAVNVQYQPKGDRNITWLDFFGKENLAIIEKQCADGIHKFGYRN